MVPGDAGHRVALDGAAHVAFVALWCRTNLQGDQERRRTLEIAGFVVRHVDHKFACWGVKHKDRLNIP